MDDMHPSSTRRASWRGRILAKLRAALLTSVAIVGAFAMAGSHPAEASLGDVGTVARASVVLEGGRAARSVVGSATQSLFKGIATGLGTAVGARLTPYLVAAGKPVLRPFDRLVAMVPASSPDGRPAGVRPFEFHLLGGSDPRTMRRLQRLVERVHLPIGPYEADGVYQRFGGVDRYHVHSTVDPRGVVRQLWSPIDIGAWQAGLEDRCLPSTFEGTFSVDGKTLSGRMSLTPRGSFEQAVEVPATFGYSADLSSGVVVFEHERAHVDPT